MWEEKKNPNSLAANLLKRNTGCHDASDKKFKTATLTSKWQLDGERKEGA